MNVNVKVLFNPKSLASFQTCVSKLKFSISSELLKKKSDKDDFVSMVSSKKIDSSKNRLYVWGYSGIGALGKN